MKDRKLSDALDQNPTEFKLQEQEGSVRRHFPKASKVIMGLLKRHNLNI